MHVIKLDYGTMLFNKNNLLSISEGQNVKTVESTIRVL